MLAADAARAVPVLQHHRIAAVVGKHGEAPGVGMFVARGEIDPEPPQLGQCERMKPLAGQPLRGSRVGLEQQYPGPAPRELQRGDAADRAAS